jgi:hypothetical protein
MDSRLLIAPVAAQALMTLGLLFWMAFHRIQAVRANEARVIDAAASQIAWPRYAAQAQRSFLNQLETPVLFYALVPLVLLTDMQDATFVALSWAWFASRLVHAVIHCTNNKIRYRFPAFAVGALLLAGMWVRFLVRLMA